VKEEIMGNPCHYKTGDKPQSQMKRIEFARKDNPVEHEDYENEDWIHYHWSKINFCFGATPYGKIQSLS